VTIEEATWL